MTKWLDRAAALDVLRVRPQTLYAYVSRGQIGVMPDPANPKRSLYRAEDIEGMLARRARGRRVARIAESTVDWGEPAIATGVSTIHQGTLIYRGFSATELAETYTLEQAAELLWETTAPVVFPAAVAARDPWGALAEAASVGEPMLGRGTERLQQDAAAAVARLGASFGVANGPQPIHERLAKAWSPSKRGGARIRRSLVVIADHELNASTFATRVAASTGASMAASLLAGLSTLSGPRHGGAGAALGALIDEVDRAGSSAAVTAWLARGLDLPGFGHPLYPEGDPRAVMLLDCLTVDPLLVDLRRAVNDVTGKQPNVDYALVAMARADRLPSHAPFALFVLGRSVGWAAHAIEQIKSEQLIRPRARYKGSFP